MPLSRYWMLVDQLARMSLRADASRYFLGYIWWILEPLLFVAVFFLVFQVILGTRTENFLVFLICGKFTFIWFSKSVIQASRSIAAGKGLIGRLNLPKSLFPIATIHEGLYKQFSVFLLLAVVLLAAGFDASWTWAWAIPVMVVQYLLIIACGLIASFLVCLFFDFTMVVQMGMLFLLFVSGIFWDPRTLPDPEMTNLVLALNPMAFLIDAYRQILMVNVAPDLTHLLLIAVAAVVVIAVMLRLMQRHSQYLALRALML